MERRHLLKLTLGFVAGATLLAASAQAAPLLPLQAEHGLTRPHREGAEPAVISQDEVDRLKPEQVRWGHHGHWHHGHGHWHHHHWHRRHWGWHHRHWHRWHRHHWRHHHW